MKTTTIAGVITAGAIIVGGIFYGIGDTPPTPVNPKWQNSSEVAVYDTPDGKIHPGEYALQPDGETYLIYLPENSVVSASSTYIRPASFYGSKTEPKGMTLVRMVGRQYQHKFVDDNNVSFVEITDKSSYDALKEKGAVKPQYQ